MKHEFVILSCIDVATALGSAIPDGFQDAALLLVDAMPEASVTALVGGVVLALDSNARNRAKFTKPAGTALVQKLLGHLHRGRDDDATIEMAKSEEDCRSSDQILSPRETEVLRALQGGSSNKGIARELNIAEATVKIHIRRILAKTATCNRTQAAVWAQQNLPEPDLAK